jgi:hypothetical protein
MRYVHNKSEEPEKKCGTYGQWKCDFLWHWILPGAVSLVAAAYNLVRMRNLLSTA